MPLSLEEQLKREILDQYRSIRAFTKEIGLPYSTIDNIFKRGINGTAVITVAKVFRTLGLDMDSIGRSTLRRAGEPARPQLAESEEEKPLEVLADNYRAMNKEGRETLVRLSEDMVAGGRYRPSKGQMQFYAVARSREAGGKAMQGRRFDPQEVEGIQGEDF
ncbi:MAG TPA: hypothetical protein H9694_08645 [Firmicutes bacterium]|nr:hypothetical protein [Bacillota bacterium]